MTDDRKTMYPDDGGLKEPVREFGEGFNAFQMIREHFAPQDQAVTPSEPELLPCPFCGNPKPYMHYEWQIVCHDYGSDPNGEIYTCACEGPYAETEAEAITAWNTRSAIAVSDEVVAEIAKDVIDRAIKRMQEFAGTYVGRPTWDEVVASEMLKGFVRLTARSATQAS